MCAIPTPGDLGGAPGRPVVLLEVGEDGTVLATTPGSEWLTGVPTGRLPGTPLTELVTDPDAREALRAGTVGSWPVRVPRGDGPPVEARLDVFPPLLGEREHRLVAFTDAATARQREEDRALVRALFAQRQVGLTIHDGELAITRMNADPNEWSTKDPALGLRHELPVTLDEVMDAEDAAAVSERLAVVARTGEPLVNWEHVYRRRDSPERERKVSITSLRLDDPRGGLLGVVSVYTDVTEERRTQLRLDLLHRAAQRIGPSLDVTHNAEELARVLVPDFADLAAVDLGERVFGGEEPGARALSTGQVRRVATAGAHGAWPEEVHPLGAVFHIEAPPGAAPDDGRRVIRDGDAAALRAVHAGDRSPGGQDTDRLLLPRPPGSLMVVPLRARGQVLGALALWRSPDRTAFDDADADLAEEVGSRAALSLDNARRYTREHHTLETLQRSLLPPADFEVSAASTAGHYVPAETTAGIGGSWYDVIPLSSARVAFVIGDVAGHGLNATATMGRLRTAVQTLADMDLAPDELMTRLDDLAVRLAEFASDEQDGEGGAIGATCLYCVYDPVSGECVMASAGRTPPVVAQPGEAAEALPFKPGPSLGVGGTPFDTFSLRVGPGSLLAFFSEELVADRARLAAGDPTRGDGAPAADRMSELSGQLTDASRADRSPAQTGRAVLDRLLPGRAPTNDVALLVARVRPLPPDSTADWQLPAEPSVVGRARDLVLGKLSEWDLTENAFPTELIISELITNAIRYAGGPVGVRLIRDEALICEVSDPSETQPHLRRARPTDEGGRGLFLVAQLAHRWGSRYTATGKTIWTEQPLA
ncbi:Serine phosphatase RsbU, regulator of sigma subunit [Streptomyces zhaozhouensis]|uniref:Serine phosphatase RsbU, regulator of sigma subunit n=1 Tax=Streptomyces zhaozhouensis TaxID=1300267 RepID=A0A286DZQ1_9ACTN|nr:SpoIIE family protein phosphatase [Streptomyces zhaozhouensis]SOD64074.1 Serine phosphatase RsbU, regulator of sigma subunit [Streptomyces zhaozhouensis]